MGGMSTFIVTHRLTSLALASFMSCKNKSPDDLGQVRGIEDVEGRVYNGSLGYTAQNPHPG